METISWGGPAPSFSFLLPVGDVRAPQGIVAAGAPGAGVGVADAVQLPQAVTGRIPGPGNLGFNVRVGIGVSAVRSAVLTGDEAAQGIVGHGLDVARRASLFHQLVKAVVRIGRNTPVGVVFFNAPAAGVVGPRHRDGLAARAGGSADHLAPGIVAVGDGRARRIGGPSDLAQGVAGLGLTLVLAVGGLGG